MSGNLALYLLPWCTQTTSWWSMKQRAALITVAGDTWVEAIRVTLTTDVHNRTDMACNQYIAMYYMACIN